MMFYHMAILGLISLFRLKSGRWIKNSTALSLSFYLVVSLWVVGLVFDSLSVLFSVPVKELYLGGVLDRTSFSLRLAHLFEVLWVFISLRTVLIYKIKLSAVTASLLSIMLPIVGRILFEQPNLVFNLVVNKFYYVSTSDIYLSTVLTYLTTHVFILIILVFIFVIFKKLETQQEYTT